MNRPHDNTRISTESAPSLSAAHSVSLQQQKSDSIQLSSLFLDETLDLANHSASAFKVLIVLASRMVNTDTNSVVISHESLKKLTGLSVPTVKRALNELREDEWIGIRKVGTMNVYTVNSAIFWKETPSGQKFADIRSTVVINFEEQDEITQNMPAGHFTRHLPLVKATDYGKASAVNGEPQGNLFPA
jgi:hypothetical protein